MGEMADMALDDLSTIEGLRDDYVNGCMDQNEAFDNGFIDSYGSEQEGIQAAWDRNPIPTEENLNNALFVAEVGMDKALHSRETHQIALEDKIAQLHKERRKIILAEELNEGALENLKKERPTCNVCYLMMQKRTGKYGDFYFCPTGCEKQSTASDNYWQSVRVKE